MNLKIKVLFCVALSLFCVKMDAGLRGVWRGEKPSNGYYYIYSYSQRSTSLHGFLGHEEVDGVYKVVLKGASLSDDGGDLFKMSNVGAFNQHQNQYAMIDVTYDVQSFLNCSLDESKGIYLTCYTNAGTSSDPGTYTSKYSTKEKSGLFITGYDITHFGMDNMGSSSVAGTQSVAAQSYIYTIFWQRYYLNDRIHLRGHGVGNECSYWRQTEKSVDEDCAWIFITPKQYETRIELSNYLDNLDAKVASGQPLTDEEKAAYEAAESVLNAETFNSADADAAYEKVEDASASLKRIKETEANLIELNETYKSVTGVDNPALLEAINDCKYAIADGTSSNDLEVANSAAKVVYDKWSALDYTYYVEVKGHAAALNYYPNADDIALINRADTQEKIYEATESLRGNAINYVVDYTGKGGIYPYGTNFTLFVVNSSFERASTYGWEVTGNDGTTPATGVYPNSNSNYSTTGVDGNYLFSSKESKRSGISTSYWGKTLSQEITELPAGKYTVSAKLATKGKESWVSDDSYKTYLNVDINGVDDLNAAVCKGNGETIFNSVTRTFNVSQNDKIKIKVEGDTQQNKLKTYYRADDFELTYLGKDNPVLSTGNFEGESEFIIPSASYEKVASRTLSVSPNSQGKDVWNSLCLPFEYNKEQGDGVIIMELDGLNVTPATEDDKTDYIQFVFKSVDKIEAGHPYLVKITDDKLSQLVSENVQVSSTITNAGVDSESITPTVVFDQQYHYSAVMVGSFVKTTVPTGSYVVKAGTNELAVLTKPTTMKGYRAYLSVARVDELNIDTEVNPANVRMAFSTQEGEEITNIDGVEIETAIPNGDMFDLTGRRITTKPAKGFYIVNGKKYINR